MHQRVDCLKNFQEFRDFKNDLQDDVNISINQSDSNPEVENDVNQDQPKVPENKTQLRRSSRVRHCIERYGDPVYY